MTKKEYLDSLSEQLGTMSYNDVKEILAEIEEHFAEGIIAGKSESEISEALGDPKELGLAYLDGNEAKIKSALRKVAPKMEEMPKSTGRNTTGPLFVVLFNLLVGIPVWFILLAVLIILGIVDIAMVASVVWLAFLIPASGAFIPGLIFLDISILFGAIFLFCLLWFPVKYFFISTGKYIKWNQKVWEEGF